MNSKIQYLIIIIFCFILFGGYLFATQERGYQVSDVDGQKIEEISSTQYDRLSDIDRLIMQDISTHMNRIEPTDGEETP